MSELRRTLGLWHGVGLYAGAVLGTGVLVLPAIAADTAGPASVLAWLGLVIVSVPLAVTYAALARQRPDAGGFADAIERAFGPRAGAVAGWLFLAQVPTGSIIVALIAGDYAASCLGGRRELATLLGGALVLAAYAVNFAGLRVSAAVQLTTLGVITLGIVIIVAWALPGVEAPAFTPFAPHGSAAIGVAAAQLFWAFVGWEAITPLAQEFRSPRDIVRASLIALAVVGALYLTLAVAVVGTHAYGPSLDASAPLVLLASRLFGTSASRVVGAAGFLLSFIPLNAYIAGTSRLVYALGQRGHLPRGLGVLSPGGNPRRALAALLAASALAWVVTLAVRLRIGDLLPLSTSAFLATYVVSMAAAVRLLRGPLAWAAGVGLTACVVVLGFVGVMLGWVAAVVVACLLYQRVAGARAMPERQLRGRPDGLVSGARPGHALRQP